MFDEADRLLKALYHTLPDPVVVAGKDRIIIRVNPAAERVFGYSQEEFAGMSSRQLYAVGRDWERIGQEIFPLDSADRIYRGQSVFRRKDGTTFEGALTLSHITDEHDATVGLLAITHDLTDVLAVQAERLRMETILQEALASIPEGFVIFDEHDRLLLCNAAYRDIYPNSAEIMVPGVQFEAILRHSLRTGLYPEADRMEGGTEAWIAARMTQHRNPEGSIIQQVGTDRWVQIAERVTPDNLRVAVRTDITALLQIKSETEALGRILEDAQQEIYAFDAVSLRYTLVNRGARHNLQYDLAELRAMSPLEIMPDVSRERLAELLAPLVDGSKTFVEVRTTHRRKDGSIYACAVRLELLDLNRGRSYVAFVEDITEKVEFQSASERLGRLVNGVTQEIYVFDSRTLLFSLVNHGARNNLQYSTEQLRQMTPLDIKPEFDHARFTALLAPLLNGDKPFLEFRTVHRRRDGSTYPCSIRIEMLVTGSGSSFVAFVEDITEKLQSEARLAIKRRNFETLVSSLPDAIARAHPDTTLTYVNEVYAQLVGLSSEEMIGRRYVEFVPAERRQLALDNIAVLTPESPMSDFEQVMLDPEGDEHVILWSDLMIYEKGRAVEIVSVGRDITERHAARSHIAQQAQELALRNEALEQFTGIVSHDLKAPLRHVRQFADMIREDAATGRLDDLPMLTTQMQASVVRMERMIGGLLEYSRVAYKFIRPENFRISEAIAEARNNLAPMIEETGATVEVAAGASLTGDFELIVQMFQNLMANSLKYRQADHPPHIRISESAGENHLEIRIEDNGIGIPAAEAENIFGVFHRLHRDESIYAGAGIGLALCRKVSESHGGSIRLDPGFAGGSRFVVSLPTPAA
ncbi:PAS domain S-box-containing protein [Hoeflea marina]|uniref:histidine kinase n=1 Tax=Hoeflea marina TaxID=274592 RepID=A0A317PSW6_9HYPH|nr:PAS domain S-box protein [Hoeflea marina]PWW04007.1 PAS domain S-box-containing protein [Hoeflea marina]